MAIMIHEQSYWEKEAGGDWTEKDQNVPKRRGLP